MERIGSEVDKQLSRFGPAGGMGPLVEVWPDAVGEEIARNAWPARIARDGTLRVAVSSSSWAFELAQLESEIAARLREALGKDAPPRLRFAPGPLPEPRAEGVKRVKEERRKPTEAERAEAERIASTIGDEELREAVARAAAESLARASDDRSIC